MGDRWVLRPVEAHCYVVKQLNRRGNVYAEPVSHWIGCPAKAWDMDAKLFSIHAAN